MSGVGPPTMAPGVVAVGWATVDLDRAARQLAPLLRPGGGFADASPAKTLGARCRVGTLADPDGLGLVLLEPDTEGRIAAFLARHGEGWAAEWTTVRPPDAGATSAAHEGPLGSERLVGGGPIRGPYRLLLDIATIG